MSNDVNVFLTNSNYNKLKSMYAGLVLKVDEEVRNRVYKENLSWILADFDYKYLFAEVLLLNNSGLVITKKTKKQEMIFLFLMKKILLNTITVEVVSIQQKTILILKFLRRSKPKALRK